MSLTAIKIGVTPTGQNIWYGAAADRDSLGTDLTPLTQFVYVNGAKEEFIGGVWKPISSGDTMNGNQFASGTLLDGNAVIIPMAGARMGCVVWTEPVAGDTVTVSYSVDGGTTYSEWPHGAVTSASADKSDTLNGAITHIKFQRTGGAGITSTYGVTR